MGDVCKFSMQGLERMQDAEGWGAVRRTGGCREAGGLGVAGVVGVSVGDSLRVVVERGQDARVSTAGWPGGRDTRWRYNAEGRRRAIEG